MDQILKMVEDKIEEHKRKYKIDYDITVKCQYKGYLYALEDIRDEIKLMITAKKYNLGWLNWL